MDLLNELQGMYIKYGQIGSGLTNTLSAAWIERLRTLEDACRPQPLAVVAFFHCSLPSSSRDSAGATPRPDRSAPAGFWKSLRPNSGTIASK